MFRKILIATSAVIAVWSTATAAAADWRRAETEHFVVYSQGSERELRDYARKLEIYNFILRLRFGMSDQESFYKLPIYILGGQRDLRVLRENARNVDGVYFTTSEGSFAVAIRDADDDILFHEYFHHLSMHAGGLTFAPGWLIEGMAEYYMTAEVRGSSVEIGGYNRNRAYWLVNERWISLEDLVLKRTPDFRRSNEVASYYSLAWLLTHWFLSDDQRRDQLTGYLTDLSEGGEPVAALEARTGMSLAELQRELRGYMRERLVGRRYEFPRREVEIEVTRLPASADDLLLLGQKLKIGVPAEEREATAEEVRAAAARHPDDPFAILQLGHAELHFGDADVGETILTGLLEREPDNVEALQLMATRRMAQARELQEWEPVQRLLAQARGFLARAYQVDPYHYHTLLLIAQSREVAADYPNDNDITTWEQAFVLAPQLVETRLGLSRALMLRERFDEAQILLRPLANAPHGGGAAEYAEGLLRSAEARLPPGQAPDADAFAEPEPVTPDGPEDGTAPETAPEP